jgi:hypothetical protein
MSETRTCACCGFTSDNYRLFIHPQDTGMKHLRDQWICRSYWKCVGRKDAKRRELEQNPARVT